MSIITNTEEALGEEGTKFLQDSCYDTTSADCIYVQYLKDSNICAKIATKPSGTELIFPVLIFSKRRGVEKPLDQASFRSGAHTTIKLFANANGQYMWDKGQQPDLTKLALAIRSYIAFWCS